MNLEHDLRRALRRESPAPGFANRVLERIERAPERNLMVQQPPRPVWWRAAAASATFALLLGGLATYKLVEYRRGVEAKEKVLAAMQIAGEKVRLAQQEVREIGSQH